MTTEATKNDEATADPSANGRHKLGGDDTIWLEFETSSGDVFTIELMDALDMVVDAEARHRTDPTHCNACGVDFVYDFEDYDTFAPDENGVIRAPCSLCSSLDTSHPRLWLDTFAGWLCERFKLSRLSRTEVGDIYEIVTTKAADLKKKNSITPESDTSTGSTREAGPGT